MNRRALLVLTSLLLPTFPLVAQDSVAPPVDFEEVLYGPPYGFTGKEDPVLVAALFRELLRIAKEAAGVEPPPVLCLDVGRQVRADPPLSVLQLLTDHQPRMIPVSHCSVAVRPALQQRTAVVEQSSQQRAWILSVTALAQPDSTPLRAFVSYYVGPLWAEGWECVVLKRDGEWHFGQCKQRWIS